MNKSVKIIVSIVACVLVGFLSSFATRSSVNSWFLTIEKPFFNPPSWVFAPVWTLLYLMMGLALGLVWCQYSENEKAVKKALIVFGIQLFLNALWSILFFGLCNTFLAFLEIIILWLFIFETIRVFKPINSLASKLLYPYLVWVSFAAVLNGSIWWLNR